MKNKKKNRIMLLLILLLAIGIGYAALATTLKINGSATVTKQTWDIYWDEPVVTAGSKSMTAPTREADSGLANTKLTWTVTLELPGDFYEFTVDAVNNGTIDAMITNIDNTVSPSLPANPDYIKYSVTYADGTTPELNHLLAKKNGNTPTTQKYRVRVYYDETVATATTINNMTSNTAYTFTFNVTYGQATSDAISYTEYVPGDLVYYDPVSDSLCNSETFDLTKVNNNESTCYKWRVIELGDSKFKDKITIQLDHNLVNKTSWCASSNCVYPGDVLTALETATSSWKDELKLTYTYDMSGAVDNDGTACDYNYGVFSCTNGTCTVLGNTITTNLKARLITADEVRAIVMNAGAASGSLADNWKRGNSYDYVLSNTGRIIGTNTVGDGNTDLAWLVENTQAKDDSGSTNNIYGANNNGYWTITQAFRYNDKTNYPYFVAYNGFLQGLSKYETGWGGARPVIVVSKNNL